MLSYKEELLQDLHALLDLGINTSKAIMKVNNGVFDKDIEEYEQDGASLEDLSDFIQKAA